MDLISFAKRVRDWAWAVTLLRQHLLAICTMDMARRNLTDNPYRFHAVSSIYTAARVRMGQIYRALVVSCFTLFTCYMLFTHPSLLSASVVQRRETDARWFLLIIWALLDWWIPQFGI